MSDRRGPSEGQKPARPGGGREGDARRRERTDRHFGLRKPKVSPALAAEPERFAPPPPPPASARPARSRRGCLAASVERGLLKKKKFLRFSWRKLRGDERRAARWAPAGALCNSVAACLGTAIAFNNFHDR